MGKPITENEDAWLGSLLTIGAVISPLPFGYIGERFGKKIGLLSVAVPHIISFISLAFAKNIYIFYLARILGGFALGGGYTLLPSYIAEISRNSNRGAMCQSLNIFWAIGNFIPYLIGPFISIMWFNVILASIPLTFFILFILLGPESPYYLVEQNKIKEAEEVLMFLRSGDKTTVQEELVYIKQHLKMGEDGRLSDIFRDPLLRKCFLICMILICTQELSGFCAITFHMQPIFQATGTDIAPHIAALMVGLAIFLTSFITPFLVDRVGRRFLTIVSCFGMCLAHITIGIFCYFHEFTDVDTKPVFWIPIFSLIFYILSFNLGICCVPWTLVSELFPNNVKQVASSSASIMCWITSFFITSYFNKMNDVMGRSGTFWIFAAFCFFTGTLSIIYVPETKGKSFIEIQEMLRYRSVFDIDRNDDENIMLEKLNIER